MFRKNVKIIWALKLYNMIKYLTWDLQACYGKFLFIFSNITIYQITELWDMSNDITVH